MPRVLGRSKGGGRFLMGEVPMYHGGFEHCNYHGGLIRLMILAWESFLTVVAAMGGLIASYLLLLYYSQA